MKSVLYATLHAEAELDPNSATLLPTLRATISEVDTRSNFTIAVNVEENAASCAINSI
jgi:hypothetical protein